jgi:hypothetical protein
LVHYSGFRRHVSLGKANLLNKLQNAVATASFPCTATNRESIDSRWRMEARRKSRLLIFAARYSSQKSGGEQPHPVKSGG